MNSYSERALLIAALTAEYGDAYLAIDESEEDLEFRWVVYLETPAGQLSWHIHISDLPFFEHLPVLDTNPWDGHTTEEKHERLERLIRYRNCRREALMRVLR